MTRMVEVPVLSRTGDTGIDQTRVQPPTILPAEAHLRQLARHKVLHQHISLFDELVHNGQTFGFLEVDSYGALVPVDSEEVRGLGRKVRGFLRSRVEQRSGRRGPGSS